MKIPTWIKALAFLRFKVLHDGTEKKFWSYEKALKYKNDVLSESKNLSFFGFHVFGKRLKWASFYLKVSLEPINGFKAPLDCYEKNYGKLDDNHCEGWIAEAEE